MHLKPFITVLALFAVAIRASNVLQEILRKHKTMHAGTLSVDPPPTITSDEGNICYLTDVEGHLEYFNEYIERSECLEWTDEENTRIKFKNTVDKFIYGGDVTDRGTGSLRVLRYLVEFKENFPLRVELILGNRDINKMRFTTELSDLALQQDSSYSTTNKVVYWGDEKKRILPPNNFPFGDPNNLLVNRVKWILSGSMGAPFDFEFRRQELEIMRGGITIEDDVVAQSYKEQVSPTGDMTRYLQLGKLAVISHNTLFTHGGILGPNGRSLGLIPNQQDMDFTKSDLQDWVNGLNEFKDMELKKWVVESKKIYSKPAAGNMDEDQDFQLPAADDRAGISLIQYAPTKGTPSVVTSRQLDDGGMPIPLHFKDVETLLSFAVKNIVCGHTPHGNAPTIVPSFSGNRQVTTIFADTGYSNPDTTTQKSDPRAKAVSEVVIGPGGTYMVRGVLDDGTTEIEYDNTDEWVGKVLNVDEVKYVVKAKIKNMSIPHTYYYTLMHVEKGYIATYLGITEDQLKT